MCGLAGIVERGAIGSADDIERMTATLAHRGPDDTGFWRTRFDSGGEPWQLAFGHTRLAILDLSEQGHQPMHAAGGEASIVYNGEIYNFAAVRTELEGLGHRFRSNCDTEVLLEAYLEWGVEALGRLNGMFAFAIWDAAKHRLVLARDRLGVKPLHYYHRGDLLLFGSELRALRRNRAFPARIDPEALKSYLRYGWVAGRRTIYQDTYRVAPGEVVVWERGGLRSEAYWSLKPRPSPVRPARFDQAVDALESLLGDAVERRLVSDVPLGAFLSGGIDSSCVVALMQERARGRVKTFSIGFEDPAFDEAPHARRVAGHLGTDHTEVYVLRSQARDVLEELPEIFDEPLADPSAVPTVLLSRMTRRDVTVALSGDGGDELFGGYERLHKLARLLPLMRVPAPARRWLARISSGWLDGSVGSGLRRIAGARDEAGLAESFHADFTEALLSGAVLRGEATGPGAFQRAFLDAPAADPLKRAMYSEARTYLPDDVLLKVDRASMSTSLEVRVPLLDYRVVEFAYGLPVSMLRREGRWKAPLRALLARRLPPDLFERPKHGFSFPIRALLGPDLDVWTEKYLSPERIAREGLLDPAAVGRMVEHTRRGGTVAASEIWRLICLERWLEHARPDLPAAHDPARAGLLSAPSSFRIDL